MIGLAEEKATIVLLDSEPALRTLYSHVLTDSGYTVHVAEDAQHCIELCHEHVPDVVLMDTDSPGMAATQLVRELGKIVACESMLVIIFTGWDNTSGFRMKYEAAGADAFIFKRDVIRVEDLLKAIEQRLSLAPQQT